MKTNGRAEYKRIKGIFIGYPSPPDSANRLENFKYDPKTTAWSNMLGYEKFFSSNNNFNPFQGILQRAVDSLYCFQQHNGARQSFLFESNGTLFGLNTSTKTLVTLKQNRLVPTPNQPHTSYEPFGRYCIITNGFDGPIKFRGALKSDRIFDLGWRQQPGTPIIRSVGPQDGAPATFLDASSTFFNDQLWNNNDSTFTGMGSTTADEEFSYSYRVSFVNESGSESPLSQESNTMVVKMKSVTRGGSSGVSRFGLILDIPVGPPGTIARRIYRTKGDGSKTYFFNSQLNENASVTITDFLADNQLGAQAPDSSDSILFPAPGARFSAAFKNCLFVDGGEMDPTRLYHSTPLQPDTYKSDSFFEVGTREGGDITGLMPYYNQLLVFRQTAIDLVRGDPVNGFFLVPFIQGVGTLSPHTIVPIPNLGIMFASDDGIYLIAGGLDGGSSLKMEKISVGLQEFFDRFNPDMLPSAVGVYSHKEREAHFYFAIDGSTDLKKGIVYHVDAGTFSTRGIEFDVIKCLTTDKDGNILFGFNDNTVRAGASGLTGRTAKGGIGVISGIRTLGERHGDTGNDTFAIGPKTPGRFRSAWLDLGRPQVKKHVKYLYLYVFTTGNSVITPRACKDRDWQEFVELDGQRMQRPDHKDSIVYGDISAIELSGGAVQAKYDTNQLWEDKKFTCIRYDVGMNAVQDFAFEFDTFDYIEFIGFAVEFTADGTKTIRGKQ